MDQQGIIVFASILDANGKLLRSFPGPLNGAQPFAFVAEADGVYRLSLRAPTVEQAAQNGIKQSETGRYRLEVNERIPLDQRLRQTASGPRYTSPTLQRLTADLTPEQHGTDSLWQAVSKLGTPLLDPNPNDSRYQLVTFLWRGNAGTRNVLVDGTFANQAYTYRTTPLNLMSRLRDTDIWYLTLKLPAGARFTCQLSPNDPLTWDELRAHQRLATLQTDPLTETCGLAHMFATSAKLPLTFYLEGGVFEVDAIGSVGFILGPTRQMRDVLLAKGYEVHYHQFIGGHDAINWRGTLADALMLLSGPR